MVRNAHCSYCGRAFDKEQPWPRKCGGCGRVTYQNPIPVAVVLLPVDGGLLAIRRTIPPAGLALPGGFIDLGESWQQACAREVREETGFTIAPEELREFRVRSAPDGTVLIFAEARPRTRAELGEFAASGETSECVVVRAGQELAFPLHTEVAREWFADR